MSKRSTAALLKKARRRRESFTVLLDLGDDLHDEYDAAVAALDAMAEDDPERDAAKATVADLNARLHEEEIEGFFEQTPPLKWSAFLDEHPPRDGNEVDSYLGANRATAFPAAIRAAMVDPVMDDDQWEMFLDVISPGDLERLGRQVFELNARTASVPKLPMDFLAPRTPSSV